MKTLGVIILLPLVLWAQPEFFGYFESEADVMQVAGSNYSFGYHKFRLDIEARPNDNVLIGANINVQKYWGKTTWNIYDFIPGYANSGAVMNVELPDTILLDNVYMRLSFPWLDLTLGRQQISTGVGYAWNPTDIFNSKSLMDPSYEQAGVEALRVDIPLANRTTFTGIVQPESDFKNSTKQIFLKTGLGHFDFSISRADYRWQVIPISFGDYTFGINIDRILTGVSIVGELFEWGIWTEYGYNQIDNSLYGYCPVCEYPIIDLNTPFEEIIFGLDHTFDNSLYILTEYLHNGYGVAKKSDLSIIDYFNALEGTTHSLMQDYVFMYAMHPTFDYVSLSAIIFANLNDQSGTLGPQVDWNIFEDTNISIQASYSWGADDTEFGLQDWGLRLRVLSNF